MKWRRDPANRWITSGAIRLAFIWNLLQTLRRRLSGGKRAQDHLFDGTVECALDQIFYQMGLRLLLRVFRPVDLRPNSVVARHEFLLRHDLQHSKDSVDGRRLRLVYDCVNLADCRRSLLPQHVQNGKLEFRGTNLL